MNRTVIVFLTVAILGACACLGLVVAFAPEFLPFGHHAVASIAVPAPESVAAATDQSSQSPGSVVPEPGDAPDPDDATDFPGHDGFALKADRVMGSLTVVASGTPKLVVTDRECPQLDTRVPHYVLNPKGSLTGKPYRFKFSPDGGYIQAKVNGVLVAEVKRVPCPEMPEGAAEAIEAQASGPGGGGRQAHPIDMAGGMFATDPMGPVSLGFKDLALNPDNGVIDVIRAGKKVGTLDGHHLKVLSRDTFEETSAVLFSLDRYDGSCPDLYIVHAKAEKADIRKVALPCPWKEMWDDGEGYTLTAKSGEQMVWRAYVDGLMDMHRP